MKTQTEHKIHEIAKVIFDKMQIGELNSLDTGLLSGQMGIIIFGRHYLHIYPDTLREKILNDYTESLGDKLISGMNFFTYSSGLAGIFEGLKYLNTHKLLEIDFSDIEKNYTPTLQEYSLTALANANYDYLHGGMGIAKYLADDPLFANKVMDVLEQTADKDNIGFKWKSEIGMNREIGYNISLSHGMSSIVSILCLFIHPKIDQKKRDMLIMKVCDYILSQEIAPIDYGCFFPTISKEYEIKNSCLHRQSRLAWCYGDLGIATSLWQAGRLLNNKVWQNKAIEIFIFSIQRCSQKESGVMDAGLCHGTASIALMYQYMFKQTQIKLFKQTRDYWVDETLKFAHFEDGYAGYKTWLGSKMDWGCEYNLLDGIAGIGMILMLKNDDSDTDWMRFFLLY